DVACNVSTGNACSGIVVHHPIAAPGGTVLLFYVLVMIVWKKCIYRLTFLPGVHCEGVLVAEMWREKREGSDGALLRRLRRCIVFENETLHAKRVNVETLLATSLR